LLIDDNSQHHEIERIEAKLKGKYGSVKCHQFNVGSLERKDLMTDEKIDLSKVLERFKIEFPFKIDLICIDYNLEDEITGLDILREIHPLRPGAIYMMYSANLNQLVNHLIGEMNPVLDRKRLFNSVKFLTRHKVHEFVARDNYEDAIIEILSQNHQTLESIVEEKLLEYKDLKFQNTYPIFEGMTLNEIAHEIRTRSVHGNNFMKEIIEQAISNMVLINT
jgi:hypothetical protein